ncbi:MAG: ABC transporter ATP-binding protein/permease [Actinomycetota bacterium]|nr:ABC transporter ATP-binding protein/permease [Actinomycetota bacterium]
MPDATPPPAARPSVHPLRRLWQYGGRYRLRVVLAVIATSVNKIADVMPEILIGAAVDVVVRGNDSFVADLLGIADRWRQLVVLAVVNVVVWVVESAAQYVYSLLWRNLAQSVEHDLRTDAYAHLQELELSWFEDTTSGGLLSVLNDDVNQLERFLDVGAGAIIRLAWNIVLVGAVFFAASWQLALLAFLPIPLIVMASLRYQRRLVPRYAAVRERVGEVSSTLSGNLGGIATIKAFAAEDREAERVRQVSDAYRLANAEAIRYSSAFVPLIRMAILVGFTATLLLGGKLVLDGSLEVGLYSVLVFMTQRLLWPLTDLGETLDLYQRAMASTRRILDLLAVRPTMTPGTSDLPAPVHGDLRLDGVRFGYGDGRDVLRGVDLAVPVGETHAIVGSTGAGKSTLVRLLLRFHDPRHGVVSIDGHDVRTLTYRSLRQAIGYVSQDVFLFHGSVRDNIAYGRPEARDGEVEEAARQAEAHEFIEALPQGYDTVVGERGVKLSGGQRQRLSIARALLRDPAVLILDEATSAVDNETEAAIQRSLARVGQGRTVVVIAHRLSTVRDADRIWVLEAGQVSEAGTHDELVEAGGLYAALWRVQTGDAVRVH